MSTKIYNGFRCLTTNLGDLYFEMQKLRKTLEPVATAVISEYLAETAVMWLDHQILTEQGYLPAVAGTDSKTGNKTPLSYAWFKLQDELDKAKGGRRVSVDIEASISILVDPKDGQIYAMLFAENEEIYKAIKVSGLLSPFQYYNNTDHPKDVTEKEWIRRGEIWKRLLGEHMAPAYSGCSFELVNVPLHSFPDKETIIAHLPVDHQGRYREHALNRLVKKKLDLQRQSVSPEDLQEFDRTIMSKCMQILSGYTRTESTPEAKKELEEEISLVASILGGINYAEEIVKSQLVAKEEV